MRTDARSQQALCLLLLAILSFAANSAVSEAAESVIGHGRGSVGLSAAGGEGGSHLVSRPRPSPRSQGRRVSPAVGHVAAAGKLRHRVATDMTAAPSRLCLLLLNS